MSLPAQDKKQQNTEYTFHKNNVLKVSNAAKILGVSPSSLRRFEEEGRISSFRDPGNGYRYYRLDLIKELRKELEESKNNISVENKKENVSKIPTSNYSEPKKISGPKNIEKPANQNIVKLKSEDKITKENKEIISKTSIPNDHKYSDKNINNEQNQIVQDFEDKLTGPLFRRTKFAVIFLSLFFILSLGLTFLSSKGFLQKFVNTENISSILGLKTKQIAETEDTKKTFPNVLAARTRVSDFVQNFNLQTFFGQRATFEEGLDATDINFTDEATISGLLGIDDTTKNTLEESLSIDGDVVGTNMLSTVIKEGVVDGTKLSPEIEYEGSFDFLNGSLSIDGTPVEATAEEINILSGVQTTAEELNYISGMTVENGGILFGDGNAIAQDPSTLFWDTTTGSLEIGNGSNFTGFRASDTLVSDLIYTLPSQTGSDDYVLAIQTDNTLEWRSVTSLGGAGDITDVGSMTVGAVFNSSSANGQWLGLGNSAGRIQFNDNATDSVNILGGRLGVGTSTPSYDVDVLGTIQAQNLRLTNLQTSTDVFALILENDEVRVRDIGNLILPTGGEGQMLYNNGGTWTSFNGMTWNDTNNYLGIGTINPGYKLDVVGSANVGLLYISGTQVQSSAYELNLLHGLTGALLDSSTIHLYATTGVNAGQGLIGGGTTGVLTVDIGAGDGIVVNPDNISIDIITSGSTTSTASNSGLELTSDGLRLLGGCDNYEVLVWNEGSQLWECQSPSSIGGVVSGSGVSGFVSYYIDTF